jgi:beta-galactosidase
VIASPGLIADQTAADVVVGPDYVADYADDAGKIAMSIWRPIANPAPTRVAVYGADVKPIFFDVKSTADANAFTPPALSDWQTRPAAAPAQPGFDDSSWLASNDPPQMGADGDASAYAWYRAAINANSAGPAQLKFDQIGDDALVYLNGKLVGALHQEFGKKKKNTPDVLIPNKPISVSLQPGGNTLAVFVSHTGRDKAFNYRGALIALAPKGIVGPVHLIVPGRTTAISGWKLHGGIGNPDGAADWSALADSSASSSAAGSGAASGPAFFRATYTEKPNPAVGLYPVCRVTYTGLSRGSVWLNGHNLGRYPEKIKGLDTIYLPECWLADAGNSLEFFDELGKSPSQVKIVEDVPATREVISVGN